MSDQQQIKSQNFSKTASQTSLIDPEIRNSKNKMIDKIRLTNINLNNMNKNNIIIKKQSIPLNEDEHNHKNNNNNNNNEKQHSPSKQQHILNQQRRKKDYHHNHVKSMIDMSQFQSQMYIKNIIVDKNLIDISPHPRNNQQNNYYLNRNFSNDNNITNNTNNNDYQINGSQDLSRLKLSKRSSLLDLPSLNNTPSHYRNNTDILLEQSPIKKSPTSSIFSSSKLIPHEFNNNNNINNNFSKYDDSFQIQQDHINNQFSNNNNSNIFSQQNLIKNPSQQLQYQSIVQRLSTNYGDSNNTQLSNNNNGQNVIQSEGNIIRSKLKKVSLQLPAIQSPIQKEMVYLCNSTKYRAKTLEKSESHSKINPFLPSVQNSNHNINNHNINTNNNVLPFGVSRRSSGKEEGQLDSAINQQNSMDLFNLILNSSKNISIPSSIILQNQLKHNQSKSNINSSYQIQLKNNISQINNNATLNNIESNTTTVNQILSPHLNTNNNTINNINNNSIPDKNKKLYEESMLSNYSNPQLRENILTALTETLIKSIKNSPELNEASYNFQSSQTKKENQNNEGKVLGYQSRKDQLQEVYMSNKGQDRIYCFSNYLSKFSGYVIDLIFCDIPKIQAKQQRFDIKLTESVLDLVLPIISNKLKEYGMKDILPRFEIVFKEEFHNILISQVFEITPEQISLISNELLERLTKYYSFNFNQYSSTCKDFLTDIFSEGTSKQKISDYMQFIRMHLKRSSINPNNNINNNSNSQSPKNRKITYMRSQTFTRKSIILNQNNNDQSQQNQQQYKGIVESENYKDLLNITQQDLYFVKKTIYDVIKKQLPQLSLTNIAKIIEKIEILRFAYFKEVYSLDDQMNNNLIETMRNYVENYPPILQYFKRPESTKHITKFLQYLLESILGESTLQLFIDRCDNILNQDIDMHLISMLEQGLKGSLSQLQINVILQREIDYKFIHLKRRCRLTPPFNAIFYQIESIIKYMSIWIDLMAQQKQIKIDHNNNNNNNNNNNEDDNGIIVQLKQIDYLEFFLVCSLSDFDTFSISDLTVGLQFNKIQKSTFKFWLKGIKRIFAKLKLKQKEINMLDEYFQKTFSCVS